MSERVDYWLKAAEYDLETAQAMLQTGRYLYVGFMCHQVVEKTLKACLAKKGQIPPRLHGLGRLAELASVYTQMSPFQRDLLDQLDPLNIQARYPEDREQLASLLTAERCQTLFDQTKELYQWITAKW